jgi:hypothetical protein
VSIWLAASSRSIKWRRSDEPARGHLPENASGVRQVNALIQLQQDCQFRDVNHEY